jgi:uncharacterized protein YbjT (DUF2867 family)
MSQSILITGATGHQGKAVIDALLALPDSPFTILALTRNVSSPSAIALTKKSDKVKLIQGNLDDPQAIFKAAEGLIWGVFSVQNPMGKGSSIEAEERQANALVDAAVENGVKHFVYGSVDRGGPKSDTTPTPVPSFASKLRIENYLKEKAGEGMTYTILRPVCFMENVTPDNMGKFYLAIWRWAIPTGNKLQLVSLVDIGWFVAQAFLHPESETYRNRGFSLAGDELTYEEARKVLKENGRGDMAILPGVVGWGVLKGIKEVRTMFEWFATGALDGDVAETKRLHPGLMNFADYIGRAESGFVSHH